MLAQVDISVCPQTMTSSSSSIVNDVVTWPTNSCLGERPLSVAVFDHRKCGGVEGALDMAEKYISSQIGFYCVFIVLKPISKREARSTQHKKDRLKQITKKFMTERDTDGNRQKTTILVDLSLIAVASSMDSDGAMLLSTATPKLIPKKEVLK